MENYRHVTTCKIYRQKPKQCFTHTNISNEKLSSTFLIFSRFLLQTESSLCCTWYAAYMVHKHKVTNTSEALVSFAWEVTFPGYHLLKLANRIASLRPIPLGFPLSEHDYHVTCCFEPSPPPNKLISNTRAKWLRIWSTSYNPTWHTRHNFQQSFVASTSSANTALAFSKITSPDQSSSTHQRLPWSVNSCKTETVPHSNGKASISGTFLQELEGCLKPVPDVWARVGKKRKKKEMLETDSAGSMVSHSLSHFATASRASQSGIVV